MDPNLVAPCGMNCNLCAGYLAYTHGVPKARGRISHCRGCGPQGKMCAYLRKWCKPLRSNEVRFCFECSDFPCHKLQHLDLRYRTNYGVSFVDNLRFIQSKGLNRFLAEQSRTFRCDRCTTDFLCIHNGKCFRCDTIRTWRRSSRRILRTNKSAVRATQRGQ